MKLYKHVLLHGESCGSIETATLSDIKAALAAHGLVCVDKGKLMGWYDVLQEALENPQYDHDSRARHAVKDMMIAAQEKGNE